MAQPVQLLFKPKTAKTATPTPVLVVAKEAAPTNANAIGKLFDLKELRLASEDLIKDVLPSAGSKDDVSALSLPAPVPATLHLVLDKELAEASEDFAVHLTRSSSTILLKGTDIKSYLESLVEAEGAVKIVDLAELQASVPAPAPRQPAQQPAAPIA